MHRRGSAFHRPASAARSAAAGRGWIPPGVTMAAASSTAPFTTASPSDTQSGFAAPMGSQATGFSSPGARVSPMASVPSSLFSSPGARVPPMGSLAGTRLPSPTGAQQAFDGGSSSAAAPGSSFPFSDLRQSSDGSMNYMMEQPHNLPENSHFVGRTHIPIDIEGEEADNEDGEEVRTVSRLFWKPEEDERVMSAWLKHSIDSIKGNNKKGEQYWSDVTEEYNLTTPKNRHRTRKQVKERWHKINKCADLFNSCYGKVRMIYTSGYSEDMWLEKAHEMYVKDSEGSHFVSMNVWNMVRNQAKWINYNLADEKKKKRKDAEKDDNLEGGGVEDLDLPRPMGQKKAKKAAYENKGKSKDSAIDVDQLDKFEKVQNGVHANRVKLLELQGKLNNDKMEVSKIALQRAKEEKEAKLLEKESKMMESYSRLLTQDISGMPDELKVEHVAAIRCLRMKLFPDLS